jgi:hypothetical protein
VAAGGVYARLGRVLLYARTVRALRWEQVVYRPLRRVQARLPVRLPRGGAVAIQRLGALSSALVSWGPGNAEARLARAAEVVEGRFTFLSRTEALPRIDWGRRHVSHLWSYNLHYFEYAVDLAWAYRLGGDARFARRFQELAEGWMEGAPAGRGDGWEPYALSVRLVSWAHALLLFGDALEAGFRDRLLGSLYAQAAFLERRLEWHVLANHLQKNLAALVTAGLLFSGGDAERWRRRGAARLWREVGEQVLPDGGHYERSPMYHALAASDLLESIGLLRAAGETVPAGVIDRVGAMVRAMGLLARPDGSLYLFNDAANASGPSPARVAELGRAVLGVVPDEPRGAFALPGTGYYGWAGKGERLVIDCGEPGPAYQPGHAHCDLLSFELDLGGVPLVVDSGLSGYDGDPLRDYVRSTRAHNTVSIAGREQSEVWGTFRVARRARVEGASHGEDREGYRFQGAYRPFHDPRAVHRRSVERRDGAWTVTDVVDGADGAELAWFLHLHPEWMLRPDGGRFIASRGDVDVVIEPFGADAARIVQGEGGDRPQGWYCPRFGVAVPAPVLELSVRRNGGRAFGAVIRTSPVL